jgi:predicted small lipoprotein YifL
MRLMLVASTLVLVGALSACGQKGALYLPDKNAANPVANSEVQQKSSAGMAEKPAP